MITIHYTKEKSIEDQKFLRKSITIVTLVMYFLLLKSSLYAQVDWSHEFNLKDQQFKVVSNEPNGFLHLILESDTIVNFDLIEREVSSRVYVKGSYVHGRSQYYNDFPILKIDKLPLKGFTGEKVVFFDFLNGTLLADSQYYPGNYSSSEDTDTKFWYDEYHGGLFSIGKDKASKSKSDLIATGKMGDLAPSWSNIIDIQKKKFSLLAAYKVWGDPLFADEYVAFGYANKFFCHNRKNGSLVWSKDWNTWESREFYQQPKFSRMGDSQFYVIEKNEEGAKQINAYSFKTGDPSWSEPLSLGKQGYAYLFHTKGLILARGNELTVIDPKTGNQLWANEAVAPLSIKNFRVTKDKIITYHKDSTISTYTTIPTTKLLINIADENGFEWTNTPEISGTKLLSIFPHKSHYVYRTELEIGVIDAEGEVLFSEKLPFPSSVVSINDTKNQRLLFALTDRIYSYNYDSGELDQIITFKLKGDKEEQPLSLLVDSIGISFYSQRNLLLFDEKDMLKEHLFYENIGLSDTQKGLLLGVASTVAGTIFSEQIKDVYRYAYQLDLLSGSDLWDDLTTYATVGDELGMGLITSKYVNRMVTIKSNIQKSKGLSNYWIVDDKLDNGNYGLRILDIWNWKSTTLEVGDSRNFYYKLSPLLSGLFYFNENTLYFKTLSNN